MSFLKFVVFKILKIVGRFMILCGAVLLIITVMGSQTRTGETILIGVGILSAGIILNWFGRFRESTTIVERGTKDSRKKKKEAYIK